jgi:glycosyltransferase involved in cell wall biosynthesis
LVTAGEPLPLGKQEQRLLRAGLLARYLVAAGHEVTWWTSTFDHTSKLHLFDTDTAIRLPDGVQLQALRGPGYRRNVSLQRIRDHRIVAQAFTRQAELAPRPDVILASYPTIDLAAAAVNYGRTHNVPCVIDIRDLWPDLFNESLPGWSRIFAAPAIALLRRKARRVCRGASAITGNAPSFVEWGVRMAGRAVRAGDRHFPFGYERPRIAEERLARARAYWNERGIRRGTSQIVGCFFGAFSQQFEFASVLRAAQILARDGVDFRLVLCGTGERLEELRETARDNPNVMFPGWIEQPEIFALMELAHFGLAPYRDHVGFVDNLPNKPIEYMAGGLAVISSLSGYLKKFLAERGCGFSYPEGDAAALAGLIAALAADRPRLEAARLQARRTYEELFDADKVHESFLKYLQTMAQKSSGHDVAAAPV